MSEAKAAEAAPSGPKSSKLPLLLALVNTLAVLGAAGFLYYTKMVYKPPTITEESERTRLEAEKAKPPAQLVAGTVTFSPVTVNIQPSGTSPHPAGGSEGDAAAD